MKGSSLQVRCGVELPMPVVWRTDDPELRALLRESPMGGAIEVAFLREPNFFHTASIQGLWWREIDSPEDLAQVREDYAHQAVPAAARVATA